MEKIYYTIEEANLKIKYVEECVIKLMSLERAIRLLDSIEIQPRENNIEDEMMDVEFSLKYHRLNTEFYTLLGELLTKGILVRDLELGVVDFLSRHKDEEVYLCWEQGEKEIKYWHYAQDPFNSRRPISLLK
ncbi:Uncharacterised protein [uncultured archaeon]|nr:Uncharacterised protein [uncultured archaeon]